MTELKSIVENRSHLPQESGKQVSNLAKLTAMLENHCLDWDDPDVKDYRPIGVRVDCAVENPQKWKDKEALNTRREEASNTRREEASKKGRLWCQNVEFGKE